MSDEAKVEALPEGTRFRHDTGSQVGTVEIEVQTASNANGIQDYRWRPVLLDGLGHWRESLSPDYRLRAWYEAREPEAPALSAFAVLPVTEGADELIDDYMATLPARESVALAPSSHEAADLLATFDAPVTREVLEFSVLSKPPASSSYEATADKLGAVAARAVSREVDEARTWDDLVERVDGVKAAVEALARRVELVKTLRMWVDDTESPWPPLAMLPSGEGER